MNDEFSFNKFLSVVLPKWPLILVVTIVFGIVSFLYSSYMIAPTYVASGTLYITGDVNAVSSNIRQDTNLSDLMLSQELAKTYGQILSSNTFFKNIATSSGTSYTYSDIQSMTTISNVEDTGLLRIKVRNTDPKKAYSLANTILQLAPAEISRVVVSGAATIIDPAEMPKSPASPNIPRNTLLGAFSGMILAIALVFARNLFDNTIKTADEIGGLFDIPVLGIVPQIEPNIKKETATE